METPQVRIVARDRCDVLGEGLLWSAREGAVFWTDIFGKRLNRLSLADERVDSWDMPDVIGWIIERERGGFVAGLGRAVVTIDLAPLTITPLADLPGEPDGNRVNDAKADPAGRIWFGTMSADADRASGSFYRLDPHGDVTLIDAGYTVANGPAIAADGRRMLHTDTAARTIYDYAIGSDGEAQRRSTWLCFEPGWGKPDGMTFDEQGGLWVACWGTSCIRRFTPDRTVDRTLALPASRITNVCFAGDALDRMFVTSATAGTEEAGGALFEIDPGCRGLPTMRYRG